MSTGKHAVMNENAHILINITANIYCLNKESNVSTREFNVPLEYETENAFFSLRFAE